MKWSYKMGRVAGIDINIHATFALLIGWFFLTHLLMGQTLAASIAGLAFVMAIFGCVLLHEFGHALAARRFGIGTRDITLLPIGGVARLERMPEKPIQELWVALAGPAVNVLIAVALGAWLIMTDQLVPVSQLGVATGPFVERLLLVNVALIVFNMIPAFPMDGGRCVRALLALCIEHAKATHIAARLGQVIAIAFVVLGLFVNPLLMLIGAFVWLGAAQEARYAGMKAAMRSVPVRRALSRDLPMVNAMDSLATAADVLGSRSRHHAMVLDNGNMVGTLGILELTAALQRSGPATKVASVMKRGLQTFGLDNTMDEAFTRLHETQEPMLAVLAEGQLVGAVTLEGLERYVAIQSAMRTCERGDVNKSKQIETPPRFSRTEYAS